MKKFPNYKISLFESEEKLGGHASTISVLNDNVDIGFMVFNRKTYPNFINFIDEIKFDLHKSNMSFSATNENKTWSSEKPINLKMPIYTTKIAYEIIKWNRCAEKQTYENETLGDFLNRHKFSDDFLKNYLLPMSCAIWSCDSETILNFSAFSFLSFIKNHGLTTIMNHPQWLSFIGGSKFYVKYIENLLVKNNHNVYTGTPVKSIVENNDKSYLINNELNFDIVILATHTDVSAKIIENLNDQRCELLKKIRYSTAKVSVHSDESLMPSDKSLWCSWNTFSFSDELKCTYWINNLQKIISGKNIFVSLNCDTKNPYYETFLSHPLLDSNALEARELINKITIENNKNLYFIGAWQGHGFHEDGWTSGKILVDEIL